MLWWLIFAILTGMLFALSNTIDKLMISRYLKNPFVLNILSGLFSIIFVSILYFTGSVTSNIPILVAITAVVVGGMERFGGIFYFRAAKVEEMSRVVPLFSLVPLFVLVLSVTFLSETLTTAQYLGVFCISAGIFLISARRKLSGVSHLTGALWIMLPYTVILAVRVVVSKFLLLSVNFYTFSFYFFIGQFLSAVILILPHASAVLTYNLFAKLKRRIKGMVLINETISQTAYFTGNVALALGLAPLVTAASGSQSIFVLLYAVILSFIAPRFVTEEISRGVIAFKLIAIALTIVGIYLIS